MNATLATPTSSQSGLEHIIDEQVRKALKYVLSRSKNQEWDILFVDLDKVDRQCDLNLIISDGAGINPMVKIRLHKSSGHANRHKINVTLPDKKPVKKPVKAKKNLTIAEATKKWEKDYNQKQKQLRAEKKTGEKPVKKKLTPEQRREKDRIRKRKERAATKKR
jgi:hypothetical protein